MWWHIPTLNVGKFPALSVLNKDVNPISVDCVVTIIALAVVCEYVSVAVFTGTWVVCVPIFVLVVWFLQIDCWSPSPDKIIEASKT